MYKVCKTQQSAERQRHIVRCLMEMLCEKQFDDITVQALCRRAEIPRKTFYRYFDDKDALINATADFLMMEYEEFSGPYRAGERRTSEKDMEKIFSFWYAKRELLAALGRSGISHRLISRFIEISLAENLGRRFIAQQDDSPDIFRSISCFSVSGLFALIFDWQRRGCVEPPREMAAAVVKLFTQPLFQLLE